MAIYVIDFPKYGRMWTCDVDMADKTKCEHVILWGMYASQENLRANEMNGKETCAINYNCGWAD